MIRPVMSRWVACSSAPAEDVGNDAMLMDVHVEAMGGMAPVRAGPAGKAASSKRFPRRSGLEGGSKARFCVSIWATTVARR